MVRRVYNQKVRIMDPNGLKFTFNIQVDDRLLRLKVEKQTHAIDAMVTLWLK